MTQGKSVATSGRGQPEKKNPANLNKFGNNQRIKYPENQPHAEATETPKTRNHHHEGDSVEAATTKHQENRKTTQH
ncbi:hypothetical protein A2U01_0089730, partial [Trifolium medium]|nr:hypothetical protein [Trifolium medium]